MSGTNAHEWYPELDTWDMVVELVAFVRRERPEWRVARVNPREIDPGRAGYEVMFWRGVVHTAAFRARPPDANVLQWLDEHAGGPEGGEHE